MSELSILGADVDKALVQVVIADGRVHQPRRRHARGHLARRRRQLLLVERLARGRCARRSRVTSISPRACYSDGKTLGGLGAPPLRPEHALRRHRFADGLPRDGADGGIGRFRGAVAERRRGGALRRWRHDGAAAFFRSDRGLSQ